MEEESFSLMDCRRFFPLARKCSPSIFFCLVRMLRTHRETHLSVDPFFFFHSYNFIFFSVFSSMRIIKPRPQKRRLHTDIDYLFFFLRWKTGDPSRNWLLRVRPLLVLCNRGNNNPQEDRQDWLYSVSGPLGIKKKKKLNGEHSTDSTTTTTSLRSAFFAWLIGTFSCPRLSRRSSPFNSYVTYAERSFPNVITGDPCGSYFIFLLLLFFPRLFRVYLFDASGVARQPSSSASTWKISAIRVCGKSVSKISSQFL